MLFRVVVFLLAFGLGLGFPKAIACSYSPEAYLGAQAFYAYNPGQYEELFGEDTFIAVVKTSVDTSRPRETRDWRRPYSGEIQQVPWAGLKFDIVEMIYGEKPVLEGHIFPSRDKPDYTKRFQARKKGIGFGFWEVLPLSFPSSPVTGWVTSCGLEEGRILDADMTYLIFGRKNIIQYAEPVVDKHDILVVEFRKIASGESNAKTNISARQFFNNLTGFVHIRIDACQPEQHWPEEKEKEFSYTVLDASSSQPSEIKDVDMFYYPRNYIKYIENPDSGLLCRAGQEILVLENEPYPRQINRFTSMGLMGPLPTQRFVPVKNNRINISNIPTNIQISGSQYQPIGQVKYWIGNK